eukprot:GHRQ01009854.1.p3 GENE.GHRQ01009854.1~~GHRQ01009854.1.p3  ORF type:complete len:159 (-),score=37.85 GHRQ01009854.1:1031-1507(-)
MLHHSWCGSLLTAAAAAAWHASLKGLLCFLSCCSLPKQWLCFSFAQSLYCHVWCTSSTLQMLGGTVGSGVVGGEYGRMPILIQPGSRLYSFQDSSKPNVWMSHGDEATQLPEGFHVVAKSEQVRQHAEISALLHGGSSSCKGCLSAQDASSVHCCVAA